MSMHGSIANILYKKELRVKHSNSIVATLEFCELRAVEIFRIHRARKNLGETELNRYINHSQ